MQPNGTTTDAPARFATRFNTPNRCTEVYDTQAAIGANDVMASFYWEDPACGRDANTLRDELNYAEAKREGEERYAPETLIDEGLRLAAEDEPGWSYWLPGGRVVWVTDEPARMTPQQRYAEAQWLFAAQGPEVAK